MREIEHSMWFAIRRKYNWEKGNTAVVYDPSSEKSGVFLFDNHIGNYNHILQEFETNIDTLESYPSKTTMSRLRALGVDVHRNCNVLYLHGERLWEITGEYR